VAVCADKEAPTDVGISTDTAFLERNPWRFLHPWDGHALGRADSYQGR